MTQTLYANYYTWFQQFNWTALGKNQAKPFTQATGGLTNDGNTLKISATSDTYNYWRIGQISIVPGVFVGAIVYVSYNDLVSTDSKLEIVKSDYLQNDNEYDVPKVIGTVTIPPGETGCFYSPTNTTEASREFNQFGSIGLHMTVGESGEASAKYLGGLHFLVGWELKTPDPYEL